MHQKIAHIALTVLDYDEAIAFYTQKLAFRLVEDTLIDESKRWVLLLPPGAQECHLLLALATGEQQLASVGNQTGGRVFLFLYTDDFWSDYKEMTAKGVQFKGEPRKEPYGTVIVFEDLYGNKWDLLQPH